MCCVGLIVNQELILKRVFPRVIVNLNAELIHFFDKGCIWSKKGNGAFFSKNKYFLIFFCACLLQKNGFDGLEALSGV